METRSMPKSRQRWVTRASISTKEPASSSNSTRSRAVSLPAACCLSMRSWPPPSPAAASRRCSSSRRWARAGVMARDLIASAEGGTRTSRDEHGRARTGENSAEYNPPPMPFSRLDSAAVARALSQVAEQPADVVDAFFERREEVEVAPEGDPGSLRVWREEGFAVRLVRDGHTWLASRDAVEPRAFAESLRQVARAFSAATYPEPALEVAP